MYPAPDAPEAGVFVEQQIEGLRRIGLEVGVLFVDRLAAGMKSYLGLRRRIRDRALWFRPDVVHAMYGGVMAAQAMAAADHVPGVVTFHGSDILGQPLAGSVRKLIARFGVRCSIRAARRAARVVAVSRALAEALPQDIDRSKVRLIPCGIDLKRFKPRDRRQCQVQLGWSPECFHILFSGSADPVKRPALAQAAVEQLIRSGIRTEIHFLRGVSNREVPIWLNASDVVLITSLHEGSPTIVKEALACDIPVVSVDVGDVAERIQGIEGCYIASPEAADLACKLERVRSGPRRILGRATVQALSLESIARRLHEVYLEIAQAPAGAAPGERVAEAV